MTRRPRPCRGAAAVAIKPTIRTSCRLMCPFLFHRTRKHSREGSPRARALNQMASCFLVPGASG
eukprot:4341220-Lingulodinium_polyedra.AAC.1